MKSKITIRSDRDYGPHIRLDYLPSEDVRDELVQQFIEGFEHVSMFCQVTFTFNDDPSGTKVLKITPIPSSELTNTMKILENITGTVHKQ